MALLHNAVEHSIHLHWPSRLPVVNYFSIMTESSSCYAYNDHCQGKSRLSYHFASSPVTYQPQRTLLLSDVNVFGGLFLC